MSVIAREKVKGSGIWWLFINHHGVRKSKKIGTDKVEAMRLAKILEGRLAAGALCMADLVSSDKIKPFSFYCSQWFDMGQPVKKKGGLKASAKGSYISIHRKHVKPAPFYTNPVDRITENDLEMFLGDKRKTLARSTVKGTLNN